ncbi:MAG: Riboflavin synthase [Phycisphaerae bacterium]|nr:Riboflavin synthase [Phycisphaerae bacterium]
MPRRGAAAGGRVAGMFSGIIETVGEVAALGAATRAAGDGPLVRTLDVEVPKLLDDLAPGASVAVNGVCLTLVSTRAGGGRFHVVVETLKRSNLGGLRAGDAVNLERALRVGDRVDGHFVQGHVDALGRVTRIDRDRGEWKLWLRTDAGALRLICPKGAVALDGTSLTVVDARGDEFSVVLIPTTLERTTLGRRRPGDAVNIETDMIARAVASYLDRSGGADERIRAALGLERSP